MTVGDKIKKIRTFRGMTQKELGLAIGFEEKGADNRIAQYETNYRVPKRELLDKMAEALRVLRPGGLLMAGLDNGFNYLFGEDEEHVTGTLPFDPLVNEEQRLALEREDSGIQFSHGIAEQIGGQLRAGFRLLDVYEDTNGEGFLHEHGVPTFWATLARKEA